MIRFPFAFLLLVLATISAAGDDIRVMSFNIRYGKAREQSAALIRSMAGEIGEGCEIVLTGDFNAAVDSVPYETLFSSTDERLTGLDSPRPTLFTDTYRRKPPAGSPGEATFSGFRAGVVEGARIDWIAVAGHWQIVSAEIDRTSRDGRSPSDHYPVTTTLRSMQP